MIIYLNGPINSGKTTISKLLAERLQNSIHIEVDAIRAFVSFMTLEEAIPLVLTDTLMLTENWLGRGYHVIISWPISLDSFILVEELALKLEVPLWAFTLLPKQEVCLSKRGDRILTSWERKRIKEMYSTLFLSKSIGSIIDNSLLTVEETVDMVVRLIVNKD